MAEQKTKNGDRIVARNKRARFEYELGDTFEAGLVLLGSEVRSLRAGSADLGDAWIAIDTRGEAWVKGMRIPELTHAAFAHSEKRDRKLLLHAGELTKLKEKVERDGMTVVATSCYFKDGKAKLEVALARGRRKYDKRQLLKEREATREARQAMRVTRGR